MRCLAVLLLMVALPCAAEIKAGFLLLEKQARRLTLFNQGSPIKSYQVALGANPRGHKQREGDERTPEGVYFIDFKNPDSAFHRSLKISYPNRRDRTRAARNGVNPGGLIMIHGLGDRPDYLQENAHWTDGCIAVTNDEIEEIWEAVELDTPIMMIP